MFDRFTESAKRVIRVAQEQCVRRAHEAVDTEHVLLALVGDPTTVAGTVLHNMGVDSKRLDVELEKRIPSGSSERRISRPPFAPGGKTLLENAMAEAAGLGHRYVGTEHLLLALLREERGTCLRALHIAGPDPREIRRRVLDYLGIQEGELADPRRRPLPTWVPDSPRVDAAEAWIVACTAHTFEFDGDVLRAAVLLQGWELETGSAPPDRLLPAARWKHDGEESSAELPPRVVVVTCSAGNAKARARAQVLVWTS